MLPSRVGIIHGSFSQPTQASNLGIGEDCFRPQSCCTFAQYWKMDKVAAPICLCGAAVLLVKEFVTEIELKGSAWVTFGDVARAWVHG
jgi:hypothetical protein